MKNNECTIYITRRSKVMQSFRKGKDGWKQTSSRGVVRRCTAEQTLSHLLPALAFGHVRVKVMPSKKALKRSKKWLKRTVKS